MYIDNTIQANPLYKPSQGNTGACFYYNNTKNMNSQNFIEREVARIESGETLTERARRAVASIYVDDNKIYSYGTHYPLLWMVTTPTGRKLWVCNNSGYSSTTGKHIGWAGRHADVWAEIRRNGNNTNYEGVLIAVDSELREIVEEMNGKKRKDTQVYSMLKWQQERLQEFKALLKS